MSSVLKRKDKTSIFCSQSFRLRRDSNFKIKFAELILAFTLIGVGAWIIILTS